MASAARADNAVVGDVTFSIIISTGGRRSITSTLASITEQFEPGDEVIVVRDDSGDLGDTPRNRTMHRARGTHLLFMDDDDQYARGALATIRRFAEEHPDRIGIFRMRYLDGRVLWRRPALEYRNVSTQLFVVPNVPGKLARWERRGDVIGDYIFITETAKLQGEPIFREEIVAHVRSDRRPLVRALKRATAPLGELRYRAAPLTRLRRALGH
jgi:glycosyltransferase involved in cell wall biosynthesis